MSDVFGQYPVLITPAARGPAPLGLESTGDPVMNTALDGPRLFRPSPFPCLC